MLLSTVKAVSAGMLIVALSGCGVSNEEHNALKKEKETLSQQLEGAQKEKAALEQQLKDLDGRYKNAKTAGDNYRSIFVSVGRLEEAEAKIDADITIPLGGEAANVRFTVSDKCIVSALAIYEDSKLSMYPDSIACQVDDKKGVAGSIEGIITSELGGNIQARLVEINGEKAAVIPAGSGVRLFYRHQ